MTKLFWTGRAAVVVLGFGLCLPICARASTGGSIAGTIKDPVGRVVSQAQITLREEATGLLYHVKTDEHGHYTFPVLPVGHYDLIVDANGFQSYQRLAVSLDTDAVLTLDAALIVGQVSQTVTVSDNTIHVETENTDLGQVISGREMTAVPLNGRSFTDLLALQAGVAPLTSITSATVQDVGATTLDPSGVLNPGTISVNGQREFANAFIVNGADTEEDVNEGTAIVPNLDAIEEFRILTANYDAQYGEFSGGQINVVTKSGSNAFHGDVFEFIRNTSLDARNYFSPTRGAFDQNQFGGTAGGPLRKDKLFFFIDYQGTRQTQGIDTGNISVPTVAERTGDLSGLVTARNNPLSGSVSGPYMASLLSQKLGRTVVAGEPYFVPGCSSTSCVFPGAQIPMAVWSGPAQGLIQYIPLANTGTNTFATSARDQTLRDDKAGVRVDAKTRAGLFSAYYFIDDYRLDNPYPTAQSGASVPGFDALTTGRSQLISLGHTLTLGANLVNEAHLSYTRDVTNLGQPIGGTGVSLVSQGFVNAAGQPTIDALDPKGQSVENVNFNAFSIGAAANQLIQTNDVYQVADTVSRVVGTHTLKFGGDFHADQVNASPIAQFNGSFVFSSDNETGSDFANFLVGTPSQYNQSQLNPFYARNKYVGIFAQDSWRARTGLTLNYGLRWDRIAPWSEKYNQISTFVSGRQSVVFPGAPAGILYPGDPGVPDTLAPIQNTNFVPRIGFAWTPGGTHNGFADRLLGGSGSTSIRGSFGTFYTSIPAVSIGVLAANAPYGTTYTSPAPPLFSDPFISAGDGTNYGQPFPYQFAPLNVSRSNPDAKINWPAFEPISGIPGYNIHNTIPYTEEWMLSIERQLGSKTVLEASYVGNSSHHELVLTEPNYGNAALCLSLSQPSEVQAGTLTCGPYGEDTRYYPVHGGVVNGTRDPLGSNFGSNALQSTIGPATYNALELTARHRSERLEFFAAYTYSKSEDESSNIGEEVNPIHPALSYAHSAFDIKHNFVVSYEYKLPFDQLFQPNRLTRGWTVSGITRFSTGFPVTMVNNSDNSLLGTNPNGINNSDIDEPDYNGGSLNLNHNPRNASHSYFDAADFSFNAFGTPGTAKRRFFYGPGAANFDFAAGKLLPLTESNSLLFRLEAFNVFNHTQFFGPSSVDGDIDNAGTTFGTAVNAAAARVMQGAIKFQF